MKKYLPFIFALCLVFTIVNSTYAVPFLDGDVFSAVGNGQIQQYRPGTGVVGTYNTTRGGYTTGMAFDSSGDLYVTNFSDGSVSKFDNSGNLIDSTFIVTDSLSSVESILFDNSGNIYVGQADGTRDILKYAADGTFIARYEVTTESRGSDWIDLAADQKTMFYTSEGYDVKRYDVSTGTQLTDFATLSDRRAYALRLLDDGGLLVADSVNIKRLDSTGTTIQTYDASGNDNWFSLNIDSDGSSFWSGDFITGEIDQFDIATGSLLDSFDTGSSSLYGITVYGEKTQAVESVPEPATMLLLGTCLIGLAGFRRKLKKS